MKKLISPILILFALLAGCALIGNEGSTSDPLTLGQTPGTLTEADTAVLTAAGIAPEAISLFAQKCSGCHGPTGEGGFAPPLDSAELRQRLDAAEIQATITNGRPGTPMPAWGSSLTSDQIAALTTLVENWDKLNGEALAQLEDEAENAPALGPMDWMMGRGGMMGGGMMGGGMGHGRGWRFGQNNP